MDSFDKTQNICRVCLLQNNEEIQSVFDTIETIDVESRKFSEMLMTCAKVEIHLGDDLPDQICSSCAQNTIKLYLFKIKCEESDKTLRNRLKEGPFVVIDKIDIDEEDIVDKLLSVKNEDEISSSGDVLEDTDGDDGRRVQANKNTPIQTIVYEDYDDDTSPKNSTSVNSFNNSDTTDSSTLSIVEESLECDTSQENEILHHKKVEEIARKIKMIEQELDCGGYKINEDKNTKKSAAKSLVIRLEDCMSSLKNPVGTSSNDDLKNIPQDAFNGKHKSIASKKNVYECHTCKMKFSRFVSLSKHVCRRQRRCTEKKYKTSKITHERSDTVEKSYKRDVCIKDFKNSSSLTIYKRTHTGERPFKCNVCENKFFDWTSLIVHKRKHTGEKPYECDICKKAFEQSGALTMHKRSHTGERPFKCDICEKKYSQLSNLVIHKRKHTGEKPYECEICKKGFTQSGALTIHKRIHTGEKPFKCDVCENKFFDSTRLIVHKRKHTGEKSYECEVCKKAFTQSRTLTIHKRSHTGERPFKCDICEKNFLQLSHLVIHKRSHTGEKPYECNVCKMKFYRPSTFVIHKCKHTGEKKYKRKGINVEKKFKFIKSPQAYTYR